MHSDHKKTFINKPCVHGYTLIELLVAITIIGIVVFVAIPNMGLLLEKNRLSSANDSMFVTLLNARNQAITRQKRVVVCPSTDGIYCNTGTNPSWNEYLITYEESSVGGFTRQDSEPLLRSVKFPRGGITITPNKSDKAYAYKNNGQVIGSDASTSVELVISDDDDATTQAYKINISRTGSSRSSSYTITS